MASPFWLVPPTASTSGSIQSIKAALPTFPSPPLRVSRVGQLDAALLDTELESILSIPILKSLEGIKGGKNWEKELGVIFKVVMLRMSLFERGATYGASLQNLKYRNELKHSHLASTAVDSALTSTQLNAYLVLSILPQYIQSLFKSKMLSNNWSDESLPNSYFSLFNLSRLRSSTVISPGASSIGGEWKRILYETNELISKTLNFVNLINFLLFLFDGKYRTILDRVLGMRMIYEKRGVGRNVSFEFLNRQLVWEAFTEFLLFLLPIINLPVLKRKLLKILVKSKSSTIKTLLAFLPAQVKKSLGLALPLPKSIKPSTGLLSHLPSTQCPICYQLHSSPTNPIPSESETKVQIRYKTNCEKECEYCYYCLVSELTRAQEEDDVGWECLRCGEMVNSGERVSRVLDEKAEIVEEADTDGEDAEESEQGADQASENESIGSQASNWRR